MKKVIYTLLAVVMLTACENKLQTPVSFDALVEPNDAVEAISDSVFRAPVGTTVNFLLDGNADFISLSYSIFNETNVALQLDTKVSWADNKDNIRMYLSKDFPEFSGDIKTDAEMVHSHQWIDLTEQATWPEKKNEIQHSEIDLSPYKSENVVLAIAYITRENTAIQPMFTLSNLQIVSTVKKTGEVAYTTPARSMGWRVFDAMGIDSSAYQSSTAAGVWDTSFSDDVDKTAIKIRQTSKGRDLNEDWLICRPILIPRGKEEKQNGISVKNIYLKVENYPFTFEEYGEYTLTFYAANANYQHQSSLTRTYKFIIYE